MISEERWLQGVREAQTLPFIKGGSVGYMKDKVLIYKQELAHGEQNVALCCTVQPLFSLERNCLFFFP